MQQSYYEILGTDNNATEREIKLAYREMALKIHPDKLSTSATDKERAAANTEFQRVTEAYSTLIDPAQRQLYDGSEAEQTPFEHSDMNMVHAYYIWSDFVFRLMKEKKKTISGMEFVGFCFKVGIPGTMVACGKHEEAAKVCMLIMAAIDEENRDTVLSSMNDEERELFQQAMFTIARNL